MANLQNLNISDTGFLQLPIGADATRPGSPQEGMIRYNSTRNRVEFYDGSGWFSVDPPNVLGGNDILFDETTGTFTHFFYNAETIQLTRTGDYKVYVIGGGGSGGNGNDSSNSHGGGGAGGGLAVIEAELLPAFYSIEVGSGGARPTGAGQAGNSGGTSSFFGNGVSISASGGTGGTVGTDSSSASSVSGGTGNGGDTNGTGGTGGGGAPTSDGDSGGNGTNGAPGGGGGASGNTSGGAGGNGDADFFTGGAGAGSSDQSSAVRNGGTGFFDGGSGGNDPILGTDGEGPVGGDAGVIGGSRNNNGGGGGSYGAGGGGGGDWGNGRGPSGGGAGARGVIVIEYTVK